MVGLIERTMPSRTALMIELDRGPAAAANAVKHNLDYMTKRSASSSGRISTQQRRSRRETEELPTFEFARHVPPQMDSFSVPVMKVFISCEATIGSFGLRSSSICTHPVQFSLGTIRRVQGKSTIPRPSSTKSPLMVSA